MTLPTLLHHAITGARRKGETPTECRDRLAADLLASGGEHETALSRELSALTFAPQKVGRPPAPKLSPEATEARLRALLRPGEPLFALSLRLGMDSGAATRAVKHGASEATIRRWESLAQTPPIP